MCIRDRQYHCWENTHASRHSLLNSRKYLYESHPVNKVPSWKYGKLVKFYSTTWRKVLLDCWGNLYVEYCVQLRPAPLFDFWDCPDILLTDYLPKRITSTLPSLLQSNGKYLARCQRNGVFTLSSCCTLDTGTFEQVWRGDFWTFNILFLRPRA